MRSSIFGIPIQYETWNYRTSLPIYISGSYNFHACYVKDQRFILLSPQDDLPTLPALKKQIAAIQHLDNVPVVFNLPAISNYRRQSFIENNIAFLTSKQAFLPFLGAILVDERPSCAPFNKFTYSTQQLFLFYLYSKKKRLYMTEACKVLPFTAMTLSRAVKQLDATGLFFVGKSGVKKFIESRFTCYETFDKAKTYLMNPVCAAGYIDKTNITPHMVYAGETAISKKTMLAPNRLETYAVYKTDYDTISMTDELINPDTQIRLEVWAYSPTQFSNDKIADDISVALSLQDTHDERLESAIAGLLHKRLGK